MQQLIGVYGASGFGMQVMSLVKAQYAHLHPDYLVFIDDASEKSSVMGYKVLSYKEFIEDSTEIKQITIAIADSQIREKLVDKLTKDKIEIIAVWSPDSIVSEYSKLAEGSTISNYVCIAENSTVGKHFQANIYSYIGHDCIIGDYVTFGPRVSCNGNVHIHDHVYIGTGTIIIQGTPDKPLVIGKGAFIGMGALVTKDVPPGAVAVGKPARAIRSNKSG